MDNNTNLLVLNIDINQNLISLDNNISNNNNNNIPIIPHSSRSQNPKLCKRRRTLNNVICQYHEQDNVQSSFNYLNNQEEHYNDEDIEDLSGRIFHGKTWTEEMDNVLVSFINSDSNIDEKNIIEFTNNFNQRYNLKLTPSKIWKRWNLYLSPEALSRKVGPWLQSEIIMLHDLVKDQQLNEFYDHHNSRKLSNWDFIAKSLNRKYYDCLNKWNTIKKSTLKVGRFTIEEDNIITNAVMDWNMRGIRQGLWTHLETILHRRNDVIRNRWKNVLLPKQS